MPARTSMYMAQTVWSSRDRRETGMTCVVRGVGRSLRAVCRVSHQQRPGARGSVCDLHVRGRGAGVVVGCQGKGGRVQTGRPDRVEGKVELPAV